MICVYPADCTDFSTNGNGTLNPSSCTVTEKLNGEWTLELQHPIDEEGKWQRLVQGCIIRAPVPASMTPYVNYKYRSKTVVTRQIIIYKVSISSGMAKLRKKASSSAKVLGKYKNGKWLIVHDTSDTTWFEVTTYDGKHGWMLASQLTYVKTKTTTSVEYGKVIKEVVEERQLRDQPFRIYRVVPSLTSVKVYARHIFYDLLDNMIQRYAPASDTIAANVVKGVGSNCLSDHEFTFYSDLTSTAEDFVIENQNPIDALLGEDGVIDTYGGELARDWWDVFVVDRVGNDTDVQIREGKNLTGISYDVNTTDVVTRIMPTGTDENDNILYLPEIYVDQKQSFV